MKILDFKKILINLSSYSTFFFILISAQFGQTVLMIWCVGDNGNACFIALVAILLNSLQSVSFISLS